MPKFGQTWFNADYFGRGVRVWTDKRRAVHRIPLGATIRKQLGKRLIFRLRPGNGHAGTTLGQKIQDKYKYFVPDSIDNPEGQDARNALSSAVYNWKNTLSDNEKATYNHRADKLNTLSGYNLYIREYIKANT